MCRALEIKWSAGSILPDDLVDIICDQPEALADQEEEVDLVNLCDEIREAEDSDDDILDG